MPVLREVEVTIDADAVLRGQGADPAAIRSRRPQLVEIAERALEKGQPLLKPTVLYRTLTVESVRHERLSLGGGGVLKGQLIAQHLAQATQVVAMLCTIGADLEEYVSVTMATNMSHAIALDGVGSAAVEALSNWACKQVENWAADQGMQTTIPLSPGMIGWTVAEGQPQVFSLLDGEDIGITLTDHALMLPRKSLSMVLGVGSDLNTGGKVCDICAMQETCRYQHHYDPTIVVS